VKQLAIIALAGASISSADPIASASREIPLHEREAHARMMSERAPQRVRSLIDSASRGAYAYRDTFDGFDADQTLPQDAPGNYIRIADLTPAARGGAIPGVLDGQLSPDGLAWQSIDWGGIVDNAAALSNTDGDPGNGEYNGPVGGPDPTGVRGGMLHVQRASIDDDPVSPGAGIETYEMFTGFYTGTVDQPLFIELDIYKPEHDTFQWLRPISYTEGYFAQSILIGGRYTSGIYSPYAQLFDDPELVEGLLVAAGLDKDGIEYSQSPKELPEHSWCTLGILLTPTGHTAVFVRDSETLADDDMDGSPDWKTPQNLESGLRMYEEYGYGLEEGWACVHPGTLDDPMTSDIEGAGYALSVYGDATDRYLYRGNEFAPAFAARSFDAVRLYHGNDPSPEDAPGYVVQDWWWDDIRISGVAYTAGDIDPFIYETYFDNLSQWNEGLLDFAPTSRWSVNGSTHIPVVTAQENHTPAPSLPQPQSLRIQDLGTEDSYVFAATTELPTVPRVRGEAGEPAVVGTALRMETTNNSYGVEVVESGAVNVYLDNSLFLHDHEFESAARVWTSAMDANGMSDGRVYVRQRKPAGTDIAAGEFDPNGQLVTAGAPNLTPDQEASINTEYINVIAAPAGQSAFSLATDQWHAIETRLEPATSPTQNGEPAELRVFISTEGAPFLELFPEGDSTRRFSSPSLAPTRLRYTTTSTFLGGNSSLFIDDISLWGASESDPVPPLANAYADDPSWSLPFAEPFDTYERGRPAARQGYANHRREFLPTDARDVSPVRRDWETIELAEAEFPLSNGDAVRIYEIVSVAEGSPGFAPGDLVAISDDVLREYNPDNDVYGILDDGESEPGEWVLRDAPRTYGTWFLADENAVAFDDGTMIDAGLRYHYRQDYRFDGADRESAFVSASAEGIDDARGSRADVVKMTNRGNIRQEATFLDDAEATEVEMFDIVMPLSQTDGTTSSLTLSFDMYVGQDEFETGMHARFNGGTPDGGAVTGLAFGGKGLRTGEMLDGEYITLPTGTFAYLVWNPDAEPGDPPGVWRDTGVPVPTEQWFSVTYTLNNDSEFQIDFNGEEIADGVAIDAVRPDRNTNSIDRLTFVRNMAGHGDGERTPPTVRWSPLPFDAPAPAGGDDAYHFYRLAGEVATAPGQSPLLVWRVDSFTGVPEVDMMGQPVTRAIRGADILAIRNIDPVTGEPFPTQPVTFQWEAASPSGSSVLANGYWRALGLPLADGYAAAPNGGIAKGATPPYNGKPTYHEILLGDYVSLEPPSVTPSDVWYLDNLAFAAPDPPCPGNVFSGDGVTGERVGASDLAVLLAAWGDADVDLDLDGSGVVGSGDLAILLAGWGPCPQAKP